LMGSLLTGVLFGAGGPTAAQPPAPQPVPSRPAPPAPEETLLKYADFLRTESQAHREFLESYYSVTAAAFASIGIAFGALLTWLNWRTKQEIRAQVQEQYRQHAQALVEERVRHFEALMTDARTDFERFVAETRSSVDMRLRGVNKVLLDLSAQPTATSSPPGSVDTAALVERRVLWVDDVPENNDYPRQILEEAGVKFVLATTTDDALRVLQERRPDLIISDMGRHGDQTAGIKLLRELKRRGNTVPVIIYSNARGVREHGRDAIELGAAAIPTGPTDLLRSVHRLLRAENGGSAGNEKPS
jgi:CheY-like chemotaxis protein